MKGWNLYLSPKSVDKIFIFIIFPKVLSIKSMKPVFPIYIRNP